MKPTPMKSNSTIDREPPLGAASVLAVVENKCTADASDPRSRIWDRGSLRLIATVIVRLTPGERGGLDTVEIFGVDEKQEEVP